MKHNVEDMNPIVLWSVVHYTGFDSSSILETGSGAVTKKGSIRSSDGR